MDYSCMFQSGYYQTTSYTSGFAAILAPEDARSIRTPPMFLGLPMPIPQYCPEYPPSYYQLSAPLPEYPPPTYYAAAPATSVYYSTNDVARAPNTSSYFETSEQDDSWLENSPASVSSEDDVVSVVGESWSEVPQPFAGTFAPSYRGGTPVLLYRIPSTDLCYVYNRIRSVGGMKEHYVCRECYLKKKYVPAKVIEHSHFLNDPMAGGHICRPKCFSKEMISRTSARKRCRCDENDSGISTSFSETTQN